MYKQVLHDHLDGGLRPSTAKELAKRIDYKPINEIDDVAIFFDRGPLIRIIETPPYPGGVAGAAIVSGCISFLQGLLVE